MVNSNEIKISVADLLSDFSKTGFTRVLTGLQKQTNKDSSYYNKYTKQV